jgi:hypothetical protein
MHCWSAVMIPGYTTLYGDSMPLAAEIPGQPVIIRLPYPEGTIVIRECGIEDHRRNPATGSGH